jgi:triosephosphate isomerase (TIM)
VHGLIRAELCGMLGQGDGSRTRILYGGSVKPENACDLLLIPEVNGALVGGASLKASDFYGILSIYAGTGAS